MGEYARTMTGQLCQGTTCWAMNPPGPGICYDGFQASSGPKARASQEKLAASSPALCTGQDSASHLSELGGGILKEWFVMV